eukprot:scaffold90095_cov30-Attheya_sp.AAC.3
MEIEDIQTTPEPPYSRALRSGVAVSVASWLLLVHHRPHRPPVPQCRLGVVHGVPRCLLLWNAMARPRGGLVSKWCPCSVAGRLVPHLASFLFLSVSEPTG